MFINIARRCGGHVRFLSRFVSHRLRCLLCRCAARHGWACRSRSALRTSGASLSGLSGIELHYLVNTKHMALRQTGLWQAACCQTLPKLSWTCKEQTCLRVDSFLFQPTDALGTKSTVLLLLSKTCTVKECFLQRCIWFCVFCRCFLAERVAQRGGLVVFESYSLNLSDADCWSLQLIIRVHFRTGGGLWILSSHHLQSCSKTLLRATVDRQMHYPVVAEVLRSFT